MAQRRKRERPPIEYCESPRKYGRPPCKRTIHVGSNKDGGKGRCIFHGGRQRAAPPGDRVRPGVPPRTYLYAKYLRPEFLVDFQMARVGNIDEEIMLSRAHLAHFERKYAEQPAGGLITYAKSPDDPSKKVVRIRPYAELVQEHIELVAKLESRRAHMIAVHAADDDEGLQLHEEWLLENKPPDGGPKPDDDE